MNATSATDQEQATTRPSRKGVRRLIALGLSFLAIELILMPLTAWIAPLRARVWFPPPMYVLGQRSKVGLWPQDYVLVLGDSYAEGQGDWLDGVWREGGHPAFQATDVLHQRSGRDVVTFGRGGANNVASIVYVTEKRFAALSRMNFGQPSDVLIYFYEGNDVTDNLIEAQRRYGLEQRGATGYEDRELDEFISARAKEGFRAGLPGLLYSTYFLLDGGKQLLSGSKVQAGADEIQVASGLAGSVEENVFRSGGASYRFEGEAQGPALDCAPSEIDLALRIFERSLVWAQHRFEGSSITVVYIPSPLTCYEIISPKVVIDARENKPCEYDPGLIQPRSEDLRARVRALAGQLELGFVDTTPKMRALAREGLIHGPKDGRHFNRSGYSALGAFLAEELPARQQTR